MGGASNFGTAFNKAPDGVIDEGANIRVLDALVESGEITEEQRLAAADGYTSTKVRQLYVLSRMLDDGKITREQYVEAAAWPITPAIKPTKPGCQAAGGAAYFCQYVKYVILNDPAFGATKDERQQLLSRGGLNVYTTLDSRLQTAAQNAMAELAPPSVDMPTGRTVPSKGRFGSTAVSVEATTGRISGPELKTWRRARSRSVAVTNSRLPSASKESSGKYLRKSSSTFSVSMKPGLRRAIREKRKGLASSKNSSVAGTS